MGEVHACRIFGIISTTLSAPALFVVGQGLILPRSPLIGGVLCSLGLFAVPLAASFVKPLSCRKVKWMVLGGLLSAGSGALGAAVDPEMKVPGFIIAAAGVAIASLPLFSKYLRSDPEQEEEAEVEIQPPPLEPEGQPEGRPLGAVGG